MKSIVPLFFIILKILLTSGNHMTGNISMDQARRIAVNSRSPLITNSKIKLLDSPAYSPDPITYPHHSNLIKSERGRLSSLWRDWNQGSRNKPEEHEPENGEHHYQQSTELEASPGHGWGWSKKKKHEVKHDKHAESGGHGGGSNFSLLDVLLSALSLVSFGAFLFNLLASLLSLFGFGFTTTATNPTLTGTSTSTTGTVGGGGAAAGIVNTVTSYFSNSGLRKKKRRPARIEAEVGFGNINKDKTSSAGWTEDSEDTAEDDLMTNSRMLRRTRRSMWEPNIHPYTSLNLAAKNILLSIESIQSNYECMEKIICDSNRHAQIVGRGLEYFMPIYTFSTSYFGQKLGFHEKLPTHVRAILYGVTESNCNSNFPQCSHS